MVNVELVFEKPPDVELGLTETKMRAPFQVNLAEISSWFRDFEVDKIEIWVKAAVKSEGLVRLFVSANGEGGMRITLKPKTKD